jgi:cyclic pyranopterin phosphate synthase
MDKLSHLDEHEKVNMVDVGHKKHQLRIAKATGQIRLNRETIRLISENAIRKGNVLTTAEIAGIQGAKRACGLIPLCHPIQITQVNVKTTVMEPGVTVFCEVRCIGQTGVEMEALTGVSIALLTIYDMCKAIDKNMKIEDIILIQKTKEDI